MSFLASSAVAATITTAGDGVCHLRLCNEKTSWAEDRKARVHTPENLSVSRVGELKALLWRGAGSRVRGVGLSIRLCVAIAVGDSWGRIARVVALWLRMVVFRDVGRWPVRFIGSIETGSTIDVLRYSSLDVIFETRIDQSSTRTVSKIATVT